MTTASGGTRPLPLAADPRLADTDVLTRHQLTPELAEDIANARLAVLIDASLGDTPGCVSIREVAPARLSRAVLVTPPAAGGRRRACPGVVRRDAAGVPGDRDRCPLRLRHAAVAGSEQLRAEGRRDRRSSAPTVGPQVALSSPYIRRAASKAAT